MCRNKKADANQPQIVADLRKLGFCVRHVFTVPNLGFDIIVSGLRLPDGDYPNLLVEIKADSKSDLTESEKAFFEEWPGPKLVAWEVGQIAEWYGR